MTHWLERVVELLNGDIIDLKKLAQAVGGDSKTFYRGANLHGVDISGQDLRGMEFTDLSPAWVIVDANTRLDPDYEHLFETARQQLGLIAITELLGRTPKAKAAAIRGLGNQEMRIALILREIILEPKNGLDLVAHYDRDRAEFANRVLYHISELTKWKSPDLMEGILAIVEFSIGYIYGMRKGVLLLEFAKFLGEFAPVRNLLKKKLASTRSIYVGPHRAAISKTLRLWENR